jgi:hypothetical protein
VRTGILIVIVNAASRRYKEHGRRRSVLRMRDRKTRRRRRLTNFEARADRCWYQLFFSHTAAESLDPNAGTHTLWVGLEGLISWAPKRAKSKSGKPK